MADTIDGCIICGDKKTTKEHIIPRWLQKHYSLENQKLGLWNKSNLTYKQATIQLCQNCNGNILSRLEQRIQNDSATDTDYYLWALKIRFLLSAKDTTLQLDRKDPTKGKLLSFEDGFIGNEYVRHALQHFEAPGFYFKPNPFGSILLFANPISDGEFGFIDVPHPYWGIAISLPKNKILAVLLTDRGMVKKEIEKNFKHTGGIKNYIKGIVANSTNELIRILMLKLLINQYQLKNIPYSFSVKNKAIISGTMPRSVNYRKRLKEEVLIHICQTIGLDAKFGTEIFNSLPKIYKA